MGGNGSVRASDGGFQRGESAKTKKRWPRHRIFAFPVALLLVGLALAAFATVGSAAATCSLYWTGQSSSDWGTAGNWASSADGTGSQRVPDDTDFVCMATAPSNTDVVLDSATTSTIGGIAWPAAGGVEPSLQVDGILNIGSTANAADSTVNQLTDNGTVAIFKDLALAAGSFTMTGDLDGPGTLSVSGSATITGPTDWSDADADGVLGTLGAAGSAAHLVLQGSSAESGIIRFANGSVLENQGTLSLAVNAALYPADGNGANELLNDSGATVSFQGNVPYDTAEVSLPAPNNGTVRVDEGDLFWGDATAPQVDSGTFTASDQAHLLLQGTRTETSGATIGGLGVVQIYSGTTTLAAGANVTNLGRFEVDSTLAIDAGATVSAPQLLLRGGDLEGPGTLSVSGPASLESGSLGTGGSAAHLVLQAWSRLSGSLAVANGSVVENQGTMSLADNASLSDSDGNASNALVNDSGATLSYTGSGTGNSANLSLPVTNDGTLTADKGTLNISSLTNIGSAGGTVSIPISGATTAGTDYGQLSMTGAATLDGGTLALSTDSAYTPPIGTQFTILKAGSVSGTFSNVTGSDLGDRQYVISYTPTSVVATVEAVGTPAPTVTGVTPDAGPLRGRTSVTISGSHLTGASKVLFGTKAASAFTVDSDSQITATSPPRRAGTVDVTVTTPGGTSTTSSADRFSYDAVPTVTGVSPASGPRGGGTSVTITGTSLTPVTAVTFGTTPARSFTIDSATQITAVVPAGKGPVAVRVTSPGGTSASSTAGRYTYGAVPAVTALSPADGPLAGGNTVTVNGSGFVQGATSVSFGSTPGTGLVYVSAQQIKVIAPAGSAGTVNVTVTTPRGTSSISHKNLYAYGAPIISSFTPSSGITGRSVVLTGTGFAPGMMVRFGALNSPAVTVSSGTSASAVVPDGDPGAAPVTVSNDQGSDTSTSDFTPTLSLTGFSPSGGPAGTVVTINGVGFTSRSLVKFNGASAAAVTFVSSTQLQATVPAGATSGVITVTNSRTPTGTVNSPTAFTVG